jgi:hypothetical protein
VKNAAWLCQTVPEGEWKFICEATQRGKSARAEKFVRKISVKPGAVLIQKVPTVPVMLENKFVPSFPLPSCKWASD